jgi:hypothetical protein
MMKPATKGFIVGAIVAVAVYHMYQSKKPPAG